ncbi:uncharacterized protein LOC142320286 [Lycorma delicatula]|uniref:uncharacterized protein LOC142320286 n=1 Tax=Lycorma delicatula TaxID=130591 RepID=UPI003F519B23
MKQATLILFALAQFFCLIFVTTAFQLGSINLSSGDGNGIFHADVGLPDLPNPSILGGIFHSKKISPPAENVISISHDSHLHHSDLSFLDENEPLRIFSLLPYGNSAEHKPISNYVHLAHPK